MVHQHHHCMRRISEHSTASTWSHLDKDDFCNLSDGDSWTFVESVASVHYLLSYDW
jgi:hypothetical protein